MTTYIIDNNGEYEDRSVYFVESALPIAAIEAAVADYSVVGVADKVAVRDDLSRIFFQKWLAEQEEQTL